MITLSAEAKHLGTFGHTFDIIETDLLEVITKKLNTLEKEGFIIKYQYQIQEKMQEKIKRPAPVEGVIKTRKYRSYFYDPSIRIPYDLRDNQGNIFIKAGTIVNPLETHQLSQDLIFIDGDDEAQVKWATQRPRNKKIILVKGSPFELMHFYPETFYFDQGGNLVKKFGLTQIPARVSQEGKTLKVEEIEMVSK